MNTDTNNTKEIFQEEDKFWAEFERQYFTVPHPSLIACLKNHIWHCKYIYKQTIKFITSKSNPNSFHCLNNENNDDRHSVPSSIKLPIKRHDLIRRLNGQQGFSFNNNNNNDIFKYLNNQYMGSLSNEHVHWLLENDDFFNPLLSAKYNNQRLPSINSTSLPDAIHLTIYFPDIKSRQSILVEHIKYGNGFMNATLSVDTFPEILYGPSPVWITDGTQRFKRGTEIGQNFIKCHKSLSNPRGYIFDPAWISRQYNKFDCLLATTDLSQFHGMIDSTASSKIEYSPLLYNFVLSKPTPICRRCLGIPKVSCSLCRYDTTPISNHSTNVCFNSQIHLDDKYQMVYNNIDITYMRNSINDVEVNVFSDIPHESKHTLINKFDDDIHSVLYNYLQTLEKLGKVFEILIKRVENDHKPNYNRWLDIESQMLKNYIDQYTDKLLDTRYTYTTQKQSVDLLRLRLNCPKSSCLPPQWTDCALCSICGSDEDWDDDPILFCDCCYIPMHFCCLGFKPGTLPDIAKQYKRRHYLLNDDELDDDSVFDDDEWLCPTCLFLLDQIMFIDESISFSIIRNAAGPRNKQQINLLAKDIPPWDDYKNVDNVELPIVVGFEYDNPYERIYICDIRHKQNNDPSDTFAFNLGTLLSESSTPLLIISDIFDLKPPLYRISDPCSIEYISHSHKYVSNLNEFANRILDRNETLFEENFHMLLKRTDHTKIMDYLTFIHQDDSCLPRLVQQDRIVEDNKAPSLKRLKKDDKPIDSSQRPLRVNSVVEVDDHYTLCNKNPLKKLVISVKVQKSIYVNLKIPICIFCGFDAYFPGGGPMKRTSNMGTWGHLKCAQGMDCTITPTEIDYSTFVPKIKALKCIICQNWGTSIIQCSYGSCCKAFHIPCAASSPACLFSWDTNGRPDVLCPIHATGIAPTALLRKLQSRIQQQRTKDHREQRTSIDSISPKDDVYLTHILQPNYRSIGNLIERILDIKLFKYPLMGDYNPNIFIRQKSDDNINNEFPNSTQPLSSKLNKHSLNIDNQTDICNVINAHKINCLWCNLGLDESSHYRHIFDDKTPPATVIGSIIFSDYDAIRREYLKLTKSCDYKTTASVISEICSLSNIIDDKLCMSISNDFIDGKN